MERYRNSDKKWLFINVITINSENNRQRTALDLCDKVLDIPSSQQPDFDFPMDDYYDDFKIAIAYCEKQNNIIRNTAFDEKVVRKN